MAPLVRRCTGWIWFILSYHLSVLLHFAGCRFLAHTYSCAPEFSLHSQEVSEHLSTKKVDHLRPIPCSAGLIKAFRAAKEMWMCPFCWKIHAMHYNARYGHCLFHWGHEPAGRQRLCSGFLAADGINSFRERYQRTKAAYASFLSEKKRWDLRVCLS